MKLFTVYSITSSSLTLLTLFIVTHHCNGINRFRFKSRSEILSFSCPKKSIFFPCDCLLHDDVTKVLRCGGHVHLDLYGIFQTLSMTLPDDEKHFHMFYLNNTALIQFGNVFHDITFDYLYLDNCTNLEKIHPEAFEGTGKHIKEVRVWGTKLKASDFDRLPNLQHLTLSTISECPPENVIKPCRCEVRRDQWQWVHGGFTRLVCGGETEDDLISAIQMKGNRTVEHLGYSTARRLQIYFQRLSEVMSNSWKQLDEFVLQNSPIAILPRNAFSDIGFYSIRIENCPYLVTLQPTAFTVSTAPYVQELVIRRTALSSDSVKLRDTFTAITSLTNLRVLYLHWSGLQLIPHHAFRPLTGKFQRKLINISIKYQDPLSNNSLKSVGSYAFYYLPNIKTIDLSLNSINRIYINAFASRWPTNDTLELNLSGNNLSDHSFEFGSLLGAQRPVELVLSHGAISNPNLKHLDERVFLPFLKDNSRNKIKLLSDDNIMGESRIHCDCGSRWMFDSMGRIRNGLEHIQCISGVNMTWDCLPSCLLFGKEMIHCGSNDKFYIADFFETLSRRLSPNDRHFEKLVISNPVLENLPPKSFGRITFKEIKFDGCHGLLYVDSRAFHHTANMIKRLTIRNTKALSRSYFSAFRFGSLPNLSHVDLSFDGGFRLFPDAFKYDRKSNQTLTIRLNRDNIHNGTVDPEAFTHSQRPIHLYFDSYKDMFDPFGCQLMFLEENVYARFLAAHPDNEIHILWCPVVCDCGVKWLFDAPKDWWRRVDAGHQDAGLQCHDFRSLYLYTGEEFRHCPPTNLLQYFDLEAIGNSETITDNNDLDLSVRTLPSEIRTQTPVLIETPVSINNNSNNGNSQTTKLKSVSSVMNNYDTTIPDITTILLTKEEPSTVTSFDIEKDETTKSIAISFRSVSTSDGSIIDKLHSSTTTSSSSSLKDSDISTFTDVLSDKFSTNAIDSETSTLYTINGGMTDVPIDHLPEDTTVHYDDVTLTTKYNTVNDESDDSLNVRTDETILNMI